MCSLVDGLFPLVDGQEDHKRFPWFSTKSKVTQIRLPRADFKKTPYLFPHLGWTAARAHTG